MSRKELMLMRRVYTTGFRRGYLRARAEFHSQTEAWEHKLNGLEEGYDKLVTKIRREQAIREAVTERATIMRLN